MKPGDVVMFVDKAGAPHKALVLSTLDNPTGDGSYRGALELIYVDDEHHYSVQSRAIHESEATTKKACWR